MIFYHLIIMLMICSWTGQSPKLVHHHKACHAPRIVACSIAPRSTTTLAVCGIYHGTNEASWSYWTGPLGSSTGTISMIKSLVTAVALTIGLTGYAFAQDTVTGAPAGTAPVTPAPGTPAPIPGMMGASKGSHMHHHPSHHPKHHTAAAPMASPTDAPK
jgi:hypothetical protein